MRPRRTGAAPLGHTSISIERRSAVEGKERVTCRLVGESGSFNGRNERNAAAHRRDAYGTAACAVHRRSA